jgi:hypothetical protein
MDLSRLTLGSKLVIGLGVLLLIDSFLHWQEVSFGGFSAGVSMWHGVGIIIGLLLLAILALEVAQIANANIALGPLSRSMVIAVLSALLVLLTLIKVLTNSYVATWAWIGLVLSAGIAAGAWMSMQAAGESFSDMKASMASAASSTTAAAKTAVSSSPSESSPAPATPDTAETGSDSEETAT